VTCRFIEQHKDQWPVRLLCATLEVSPAGYYAWRTRPASAARQRRAALLVEARAIHQEVKGRYGSPRLHAELRARGHGCCVNTVAKLMADNGIRAKTTRKFRHTTDSNHKRAVADNLLDRQFDPDGPNVAWSADITFIPTADVWLYLAVVEDLFSRMIVGWSMDATMTSRLVVDALDMALGRRVPEEGLLAHSDRGSQYASEHYQRLLQKHGIACSMSGVAQCWDIAPVESFFASLKKELVHQEKYTTREQAKASIFEYVEAFYNRTRRHSSLGYLSPAEFERAHNPHHP
jgi:transposase InsO family protein